MVLNSCRYLTFCSIHITLNLSTPISTVVCSQAIFQLAVAGVEKLKEKSAKKYNMVLTLSATLCSPDNDILGNFHTAFMQHILRIMLYASRYVSMVADLIGL